MTPNDTQQSKQPDQIDLELLERIASKQDRQALAQLYERFRSPVSSFLLRKIREKKLIDEIYNDVMLIVWRKAPEFEAKSKVSTWVFGIAYRTSLAHSRKELKHTDKTQEFVTTDIPEAQESDASEQVRAAITALSDNHRTVIELAYYYGHSVAEISEVIDCPISTVKTRLFYARKHLKTSIETELNKSSESLRKEASSNSK